MGNEKLQEAYKDGFNDGYSDGYEIGKKNERELQCGKEYIESLRQRIHSLETENESFREENKKLKQIIEDNKQGYRSVKDALPPSDGLFYDVMGILWNDNICGGYNYHRGQYQNGFFFFEHSMYLQKEDFRNSNTQKKVIAWKPLLKCTSDQITEFCEKQGVL